MRKWLNNFWLVKLWRSAPSEITTWGKIWRTTLFVGFWVVVIKTIGVTGALFPGPEADSFQP